MVEDVVDPACKRFDGAVGRSCAVVGDCLSFGAVLLIGNANGCFIGCEESPQGTVVGYYASCTISEYNVVN